MKKATSLILILLIFCSLTIGVSAEVFNGADLFTVDLPEEFKQNTASGTDFNFQNEDGDVFALSYCDNTKKEGVFSPSDMSKKEIEKYQNTLSEEAKIVMKEYADEFKLEFLSGEKVKHKNGKTALLFQTKTSIKKDNRTGVYYQTICEFGGIDYKYTFTYTTTDEDKKDSFNEVFESINIFEGETKSNSDKFAEHALFVGLGLLIFIGIIRFIRTPEKRAQGKIK